MKKIILSLIVLSSNTFATSFCEKIDLKFKKYNWGTSNCSSFKFNNFGKSSLNNELSYITFGNTPNPKDVSLIMCGVHGDEITPVKFCFDLLNNIDKTITDKLIIIAPIVSPDGFLEKGVSRTNHNGVDVNRNFPTKDWDKEAHRRWHIQYGKNKRKYPGKHAASEEETKFQIYLIDKYKPKKIFSVHSPLNTFDYDGPIIQSDGKLHPAKKLLKEMSEVTKFKVAKLPYFPGSLGNYAGVERGIPTYTLELPSSDYTKHKEYWSNFKNAVDLVLVKPIDIETSVVIQNNK
jgi:protein MpaA